MFTHGQIVVQLLFVDPAKRTQKIAGGRPQSFDGIGMDFPDAIAIIIPCPFLLPVTHRVMSPFKAGISLPLIGVTDGVSLGVAVHVLLQRRAIGMFAHTQPALPTLPANGADDGRTIVLIGPVSALFVRTTPRRIVWVMVVVPLFSPAF
jgi:hypothetical protein